MQIFGLTGNKNRKIHVRAKNKLSGTADFGLLQVEMKVFNYKVRNGHSNK
jgi:hypothetical protein